MKALTILGSPRRGMNTDILLNKVIEGLENRGVEVEKINLKKLRIDPCIACDVCAKTGTCFMKDDMYTLYDKFNKSDIIVVASPLYFNSVSSITKKMVDRCQALWSSKYILKKSAIDRTKKRKGLFICTGGAIQKEHGFIGATVVMDLFFKAINAKQQQSLLVDNTDNISVEQRENLLSRAFQIGRDLFDFDE